MHSPFHHPPVPPRWIEPPEPDDPDTFDGPPPHAHRPRHCNISMTKASRWHRLKNLFSGPRITELTIKCPDGIKVVIRSSTEQREDLMRIARVVAEALDRSNN